MAEKALIKSKERVKKHGEVLTPFHIVCEMVDLIRTENPELTDAQFAESTFLEPSAGDGNFLVIILRRKLYAVTRAYPESKWKQEALIALSSIYAIEILTDNYNESKFNLFEEFVQFFLDRDCDLVNPKSDLERAASYLCEHKDDKAEGITYKPTSNFLKAAKHFIETNIVNGNTLTAMTVEGQPIEFSWWHRVEGKPGAVRREPFSFASLSNPVAELDFGVYAQFEPCQVEQVHLGVAA